MDLTGNKTMLGIVALMLVLFAVAIFFYNRTLNDLAVGSCTDKSLECPHQKIVETQNIVIAVLILVIGIVVAVIAYHLYWKKPAAKEVRIETLHTHGPTKKIDLSALESDEKKVIEILQDKQGSAFQSEIIKQLGYSKVKISRILDRMEQKGLVERKRRGMANLVVLR